MEAAAHRFLEAKERFPLGSEDWAAATAETITSLTQKECAEVAKPEWWNDEGLKALSARVVRAVPNDVGAHQMRAIVLSGQLCRAWEVGPRTAAELKEASTHYDASGCGAATCSGGESRAHPSGRLVPLPGRSHVSVVRTLRDATR